MQYKVTQRQSIVFIAGLALGVGAAWALLGGHFGTAGRASQAAAPAPVAKATKAAPGSVAVAAGACDFKPVVTTAASDDGRVQMQSDLAGSSAKDVDAWILDGKEAVAAGRQKDAESDFLMACRAAEKLGDSGAMPQAEAMYHLGRHYASVAGAVPPARSAELWQRAERLFATSFQAYNTRYGESSDRTRYAAKGLAEARQHTGGATTAVAAAPAPAPAKAPETKVVKAPPPVVAKVEPPKPQVVAQPAAAPKPEAPVVAVAPPPPKASAAPKAVVAAKASEPPKAVVAPKAVEPTSVPEHKVAAARPPAPRARPAPVQEADDSVVVEPPARAVGSATSHVQEPDGVAQ